MTNYVVINHDGMLCVATRWMRHDSKPVDYRQVYHTGLKVIDGMDDHSWLIDSPCEYDGNDLYWVCANTYIKVNGNWSYEEKAIKRPKWAKGYLYGEWKRYEVEVA